MKKSQSKSRTPKRRKAIRNKRKSYDTGEPVEQVNNPLLPPEIDLMQATGLAAVSNLLLGATKK